MGEQILVVRADELKKRIDFQRFLALPEEEIHKLYASVEVFAMDRDKAEHDPTYKQLVAYTAIHYNYSWLTYRRGSSLGEARLHGNRSMGIGGHINADDHANLFLDDHLKVAAYREVDEEVIIREKYDLRLAGLLNDDSNDVGRVHLGLVYVARLRQPDVEKREKGIAQIRFCGNGDLQQEREEFETWSQILIDNLHAL